MIDAGKMNAVDFHQPVRSILIVVIAGIGDLVLASPSFRAIRNGYPEATIHLLTNSDASPLAVNYPYIDQVHPFPIRQLRKSKRYLFEMLNVIRELREKRFDALINLYQVGSIAGAAKMGLMFSLLRATAKFGQNKFGFGCFLDETVNDNHFKDKHMVDAMIAIAKLAGGITDTKGIEVFWNKKIEPKWEKIFPPFGIKCLVGINPGGDRENRRWNPDKFVTVAQRLIDEFKVKVILLGGPTDRKIASYIAERINSDVTDLSGMIPVDELPFIISRLDLLITNDSGPMHIAAATKTPLVALFGPEDPSLFGPYVRGTQRYQILHKNHSNNLGETKIWRPTSVNLITTEDVLSAVAQLLGSRYRH
jgi:lipopolysaccharide heptosyltransferase II